MDIKFTFRWSPILLYDILNEFKFFSLNYILTKHLCLWRFIIYPFERILLLHRFTLCLFTWLFIFVLDCSGLALWDMNMINFLNFFLHLIIYVLSLKYICFWSFNFWCLCHLSRTYIWQCFPFFNFFERDWRRTKWVWIWYFFYNLRKFYPKVYFFFIHKYICFNY
jgi:hypothetical protein